MNSIIANAREMPFLTSVLELTPPNAILNFQGILIVWGQVSKCLNQLLLDYQGRITKTS